MKQKLRDGTVILKTGNQDRILAVLYGSVFGRILLKPLTVPILSKMAGMFLSAGMSRALIKPFVRRNHIDMSQFEKVRYKSYNDFFSRKIKAACRPVDMQPEHLISPCDSKLTVLSITAEGMFNIKHTVYNVASLLKDDQIASEYQGGNLLIFRLSVDDYHRYCFVDDCQVGSSIRIPGKLHTVNPIANDYFPIYKENTREYCVCHSHTFGDFLMMEVGALLVGKIVNHPVSGAVKRGQEKGYFQFGGSTVILLFKPGAIRIDEDIIQNSKEGYETIVKFGEKIGTAERNQKDATDKRKTG